MDLEGDFLGRLISMFEPVNKKLERAGYFLNNLKTLADEAGGFAYIKKQQEMRANLDGFFFEIISAKDFFLQGINDEYRLGLKKKAATDIGQLKCQLGLTCLQGTDSDTKSLGNALKAVETIGGLLSEKDSWLWTLNNFRNSATHREPLPFGHEAETDFVTDDKELFEKVRRGQVVLKPILAGQEREIPLRVPRVDVPRENIKTYLFKDPEDSSQGNMDIEIIPYCEQSLAQMKELLERLYSELGLE